MQLVPQQWRIWLSTLDLIHVQCICTCMWNCLAYKGSSTPGFETFLEKPCTVWVARTHVWEQVDVFSIQELFVDNKAILPYLAFSLDQLTTHHTQPKLQVQIKHQKHYHSSYTELTSTPTNCHTQTKSRGMRTPAMNKEYKSVPH